LITRSFLPNLSPSLPNPSLRVRFGYKQDQIQEHEQHREHEANLDASRRLSVMPTTSVGILGEAAKCRFFTD